MEKLSVFLLMIFMLNPVFAETTKKDSVLSPWSKELMASLNLSQASFDNWQQGGENTFAWQLNVNGKLDKTGQIFIWANSGKFHFGQSKAGDSDSKTVIDEIKLESVLTYQLDKPIKPYASGSFQTQSAAGYSYDEDMRTQISGFMDPGYFREAVGLNYILNESFKTRLGASAKQTVADAYAMMYTDDGETDEIETSRKEYGAEWVTDFNCKFNENIAYNTKLELFSTFEEFKATDVDWDNTLTAKISKYFNCTFNFKLYYDSQISSKRQIKQSLAMGVSYNFF